MNWSNLSIDICPKCDYKLVSGFRWHCENPECDFTISDARKEEIVAGPKRGRSMHREHTEEDNLNFLNSL